MSLPPIHGLVLCGGRSTRMGEDKGLLPLGGVAQAARVAEVLDALCERVSLSLRMEQEEAYAALGRPIIVDRLHDIGPLSGVLAAFDVTPNHALFVVACDMPYIDAENLRQLIDARDGATAAVAFEGSDRAPEPLCAIYEPAMAANLEQALADSQTSLRRALVDAKVRIVSPSDRNTLTNTNTKEDYDRAARRVREQA